MVTSEMIYREQVDLDAAGPLYPAGRRLAQSSWAGTPDPESCSKGACVVNNMKRRDYFNPAGERLATHYLKPGDEQWAAAPQGSDPSRTLKAMPASFGGAPTAVDRV